MIVVISGTATVRPDRRDAAIEAAAKMARLSRAEEGCNAYELSVTVDDPLTFRLFEEWASGEALERHFTMPHFREFSAALTGFLAAPPAFKRYNVTNSGPLRGGSRA